MATGGFPSGSNLEIGIALVLQDRFSNQARAASASLRQLHSQAKQAINANLSAVQSVASMGATAGGVAVAGLAAAVQEGGNYIKTMTMVDAISIKTGVTLDQISSKAKEVGKATIFKTKDVADAMKYMAMAGMDTKEIYESIDAVANLAGATMMEMGGKGGTADIMTNVMRMFSINTTKQDTEKVADILAKTAARSNTSLADLAEAIKYGGNTVKMLGGGLESASAMAGVLGDAGIQGSMAGTAIQNMYQYFARSVGGTNIKGHKALLSLGFTSRDFMDANGNLMDMGMAMYKISQASKNMGNVEFFNIMKDMLGVRGLRSGATLVSSFERYKFLLDEINNSEGFSATVMAAQMNNLGGEIERLTSNLEALRITFAESVAPVVTPFLKIVTKIIGMISSVLEVPILGTFISGLFTIITVVGTLKLAVLALKMSLKMTFNDSTISFGTLIATIKSGWASATASAATYGTVARGAGAMAPPIMARPFGMSGKQFSAGTMSQHRGQWMPGGYMMSPGGYYYQKTADGVKRVGKTVATEGMGKAIKGGIGKAIPVTLSGGIGRGLLAGLKGLLGLGGFLRIAGMALKGLLALFGGPIGIAISLLIGFLPSIISGIGKLFNSNKENTAAIKANTKTYREVNTNSDGGLLTKHEKDVLLIAALENLNRQLAKSNNKKIVINVDGKTVMQQTIDMNQNQDLNISEQ